MVCKTSPAAISFGFGSTLQLSIPAHTLGCIRRGASGLADPILTAVDDNRLAGNKSRIFACQKQNCACDILRFSQPLDSLLVPGAPFFAVPIGAQWTRLVGSTLHQLHNRPYTKSFRL